MTITFVVSLKVEYFDKWHTVFSSMSDKRENLAFNQKDTEI